jgi:DNA-binding LytR/AlgR family response regulator
VKKILVIEDDKNVRENIKTLLSEEGYIVYSASAGDEGIIIAKNEIPDLIVCDIMMHGKDGYAVLKELSKNSSTKSIPFIFLTAKVERSDLRYGMELGADDYLFKPFKSEELLKSIESRLRRADVFKAELSSPKEKPHTNTYTTDDKILINVNGKPQLIKIIEILFITAENQYTSLNLIGGKSYLIRKSISYWEKILPEKSFLRIHRSTIINMEYLLKIEKYYNSSFLLRLKNVSEPFIISKRYATKLRTKII